MLPTTSRHERLDVRMPAPFASLSRFTGTVGLVAFVLIFVPVVGSSGEEPGFDGSAAAVQRFFASTGSEAAQLGRFVLVVGLLAFAWFAVGLTLLLAEAEGRPAWRSALAAASALLFVASGLNGQWQAASYRVESLTPELATYAFDVGNLEFANGWVAMGGFAACVGWVALRTAAQPRWWGVAAVVSGLGLVASRAFWTSDLWLLPYALFWLTVIAISVRLVRSASGPVGGQTHDASSGSGSTGRLSGSRRGTSRPVSDPHLE